MTKLTQGGGCSGCGFMDGDDCSGCSGCGFTLGGGCGGTCGS